LCEETAQEALLHANKAQQSASLLANERIPMSHTNPYHGIKLDLNQMRCSARRQSVAGKDERV